MSASPETSSVRLVTCPGCGGRSVYGPGNPFRPFCSEPCKNHDFGAWATESYRVAAPSQDDSAESSESSDPH